VPSAPSPVQCLPASCFTASAAISDVRLKTIQKTHHLSRKAKASNPRKSIQEQKGRRLSHMRTKAEPFDLCWSNFLSCLTSICTRKTACRPSGANSCRTCGRRQIQHETFKFSASSPLAEHAWQSMPPVRCGQGRHLKSGGKKYRILGCRVGKVADVHLPAILVPLREQTFFVRTTGNIERFVTIYS